MIFTVFFIRVVLYVGLFSQFFLQGIILGMGGGDSSIVLIGTDTFLMNVYRGILEYVTVTKIPLLSLNPSKVT